VILLGYSACTIYSYFSLDCENILQFFFRMVRLLWGKYNGRSIHVVKFYFVPHTRSLRDFPKCPGLLEELLPLLLEIWALKGRAVVLEGAGITCPTVWAVFWELGSAIGCVEFSADALPTVSITITLVGLWDRQSARH
jgi:hypothetical protein